MRVAINDTTIIFPTSLSEFTLGQRIDFHQQYGAELDQMLESILKMEEGPLREVELTHFHFEKMVRTFAFFAGLTTEAVRESEFIDDIARIYYASVAVLFDDEASQELRQEFIWNGETWVIDPPQLAQGGKITFGEFIDSKQVVQDLIRLGMGKWEYMLPLCAIYLRKKDEPYQESFLYEGSERLELMKSLPMDIALQVGFFLTSSMNMYINTLQSSTHPELRDQETTASNTLSVGAGSTS